MSSSEISVLDNLPARREQLIDLPSGLLGFEAIKRFVLISNPDEAPFSWLQGVGPDAFSFLVIPGALALPGYQPELSDEDTAFLRLTSPDEAFVLNIVTLRSPGTATVNLKGPIVVNKTDWRGKQVVLVNAAAYGLQHNLPVQV